MRILVTLGSCRHLDGLEQRWRSDTCWWFFMAGSGDCLVRGSCCSPVERQIPTLVDCSCHYNLLPFGRFLWRLLRGSVCDRLATEPCGWRGTQWGLACRQAREPRDKSLCHYFYIVIDWSRCLVILEFIDHHSWLAQFIAPWWNPSNSHLHYFHSCILLVCLV
jgi:hypothetical protein